MENQTEEYPFKLGEVVQLNSGGPKMTVGGIGKHMTNCIYFLDGKLMEQTIPNKALSKGESDANSATS